MNEQQELEKLYQLYLTNQCSSQELERFFELIKDSKDDQAIKSLLSATWDNMEEIPETGLIPPFLSKENIPVRDIPVRPLYTKRIFRQLVAAAAILIVFTTAYLYRSDLNQVINPVHQLTLFSKNGERKQLQLADGTKVWLSPNSKLNYPDQFNGSKRIVSLDGEAFFEVSHDAAHPFIIQTGKVSTKVLGTSFNVSAYKDQPAIDVTLVTGKVAVSLKTGSGVTGETIVKNQRITVDKAAAKIVRTDFPGASDFLNRRLGLFEYKGSLFSEVIADLEVQQHLRIRLNPALLKGKFYGRLDMNESIEQCLDKLCIVMETSWKKEGGQYVIMK